jgi:hypothetical protein
MGDIAGAGLLAHVPTIMLPHAERLELNEGKEISLVPGLERLRAEVFEVLDYDTVVVLDSHWHTTVEFVVSAQATSASSPRSSPTIRAASAGCAGRSSAGWTGCCRSQPGGAAAGGSAPWVRMPAWVRMPSMGAKIEALTAAQTWSRQ